MNMRIIGARVLSPDCSGFVRRDVCVLGDRYSDAVTADARTVNADGLYLLPGLIDLHTHGMSGVSFADPCADLAAVRKAYARLGITAVLPTLRTLPVGETALALASLSDAPERFAGGAAFPGLHAEGPFISPEKSGAMRAVGADCSPEVFDFLYRAAKGRLRIMTIAPELKGACEVISHGASLGVRMSMGHTAARLTEARAGADAGATGGTHLFNAMRGFDHREPGALGEMLTDDRITCELIADLVHSAPEAVRLALRMKGPERLMLVSDSGEVTGLGDGNFMVNGRKRIVRDGVCRDEDGRLAGSTFTVADDARKLLAMGVPLEQVSEMTARNPAVAAGVFDRYGSVQPGKYADFILCDEQLNLHAVYIGGEPVHE